MNGEYLVILNVQQPLLKAFTIWYLPSVISSENLIFYSRIICFYYLWWADIYKLCHIEALIMSHVIYLLLSYYINISSFVWYEIKNGINNVTEAVKLIWIHDIIGIIKNLSKARSFCISFLVFYSMLTYWLQSLI